MPGGFNAKERRRRSACRALGSPRWSVPSPDMVSLCMGCFWGETGELGDSNVSRTRICPKGNAAKGC